MSKRPSEISKGIASDLANLIVSGSANQEAVNKMLTALGYNKPDEKEQDQLQDRKSKCNIGIYKLESIDGKEQYVRDIARKDRWSFFADIQSIPVKSDKTRIVLLGESVARGFLLDPDYTPGYVLEVLLNSYSELGGTEVIDLAETNLGMQELEKRYLECFALEPDLIVFLAGNNWRDALSNAIAGNVTNYRKVADIIASGLGIQATRNIMEDLFSKIVDSFLKSVGKEAKKHDVPVVFAIPEFNLLDFKSTPSEKYISKLPGDGTREWVKTKDAAEKAIDAEDLNEGESHAAKLINLDPSHPSGYELMAICKLKKQRYDEARNCLELARDTALYHRSDSKPRIFRSIRETILKHAHLYNIYVVDLPEVFKEYLGGKIPGRDLFLDYCHFTVEGIQVAVGAIANSILRILTGKEIDTLSKVKTIKPESRVIAMGYLFGAVHNAHWGQSYDILYYQCLQALKLSRETAKVMYFYCDISSRSAPNKICKSFEQLMEARAKMDRYFHALLPPRDGKMLEVDLVNAMVAALKTIGFNLSEYILQLRVKEHGVMHQPINLLKSFYSATSYDEYQGTKPAFFCARTEKSEFFLVSMEGQSVLLHMTLRLPNLGNSSDIVLVSVNGSQVGSLEVGSEWSDHFVTIPGEICVNGINKIIIHWPLSHPSEDRSLRALSEKMAATNSVLDFAYFVFGEIYTFTAESQLPEDKPESTIKEDLKVSNMS
ncbi:hypothetical protein QQ020_35900 [Fulvivirgaceae bacterium BMA12]|uniref:SGNH hydrolase-type esterase domain-containing protein n=1 Tax=Agaribacillus aureus TaxID=3051825 RepID=A0ABT8LIA6_9BACT|nr:hypothetical protein [Fulvivirgaceae bacterium BMA12]